MAKRKRLTPAQPQYLLAQGAAPEVKSALGPSGPTPPIAHVAGEIAAAAALQEVTEALRRARSEGRMVQKIALTDIVADHLARDRMLADAEDLTSLVESIREHGQRTPIEVIELKDGKFGLISGWRRLSALELLVQETGAARFSSVLALLRQPKNASDAYVAMVEENEVRVGLSYYERARVVALAAQEGVFPSEAAALTRLFATASRAKRSKIKSFLTVYKALDELLRFPTLLGERVGLSLARALEDGGAGQAALTAGLTAASAQTPEEELRVITAALEAGQGRAGGGTAARQDASHAPVSSRNDQAGGREKFEPRPGVFLKNEGGYLKRRIVLEGPNVDVSFQERLEHWLKNGN